MPRTGSRALVILGILAVLAIALAALAPSEPRPALDPSPEGPVRLQEPSRGRILTEAEVRAQLPPEWREARLELVRYGELVALPQPAGAIHPDRLVWVALLAGGGAWRLRAYDAASGIRLITLEGSGSPPR